MLVWMTILVNGGGVLISRPLSGSFDASGPIVQVRDNNGGSEEDNR